MRLILVFATAMAVLLAACSKSGPPPLTLEEAPAALSKAFQTARMQVKKNAESIAELIKGKQFALASIQVQALLGNQDLTKEQRDVLSAALISVNTALQAQVDAAEQTAAPAPDPGGAPKPAVPPVAPEEAAAAAAALDHYRRTK